MKRFLSILLSLLVLSSHIYMTVGTHFCHNKAVESKIVIGKTHLGCGMEPNKSSRSNSGSNNIKVTIAPCCYNTFQTIQSTDEFVNHTSHLIEYVELSALLIHRLITIEFFSALAEVISDTFLVPPLIEKDFQILFQSFLN